LNPVHTDNPLPAKDAVVEPLQCQI
jgi:hypothetical protein